LPPTHHFSSQEKETFREQKDKSTKLYLLYCSLFIKKRADTRPKSATLASRIVCQWTILEKNKMSRRQTV